MTKNKKKKEYPPFSINRLKKEWPFSLKLARHLFLLNQHAFYASLRDFFVYTALDMVPEGNDYSGDEEEDSYFEGDSYFSYCDKILEEWGPWDISQYPGFFIKNNKVHYKETRKSKVQNSTKEELTIKIYTLDHIPYQIIICEGTKFYINNYFKGSIIKLGAVGLNLMSMELVWPRVFHYLLWTTSSSSMKNMLENQNYRKNYEEEILQTFKSEFKTLKKFESWFNRRLAKTERSVFEERLLNVFLFSGISEKKSKTLVNNFSLTESLDEIFYFYQQLLSRFQTQIN